MKSRVHAHEFQKIGHSGIVPFAYVGKEELHNMKQTRPHLQISPLGLGNKYGSKNPKTNQKQESRAYGTAVRRVDIQLN